MRQSRPLAPSRLRFALTGALLLVVGITVAVAFSDPPARAQTSAAAPSNDPISPPTISGTAAVGQTLTAGAGSWDGDLPMSFAYQWRRCDSGGATCSDIASASGSTYAISSVDSGSTIRIQVVASNATGTSAAQSNPTSVVLASSTPANTVEPTISGVPQQAQTLTGSTGTWTGASPITFSYQWVRCASDGGAPDGSNCASISGATGLSYVVQSDDIGHRLRLRVSATNGLGTQTAASNATGAIGASTSASAPRNTKEPSVTGTAQQGQTLTVIVGSWSGSPAPTFGYQWLGCDANGNNCAVLSGQTKSTVVPTSAEVGKRLRVRVTGTNNLGSFVATSNATASIQASNAVSPAPTPGGLPAGAVKLANGRYSIPVTSVSLPDRLVIDAVQFSPSPVRSRQSTVSLRVHVVDTRGYVVRDALVFGRSTPIVTTSMSGRPTGQDGWVTLELLPLPNFPIANGRNVQFFVRARKAGDSVLAGVSTRRLVQVRTSR